MKKRLLKLLGSSLLLLSLLACATESHRSIQPETVASAGTTYRGPKYSVAVGSFQNRSTYLQGAFAEGPDRLGNQAKTILKTHLQMSNRFSVVDRQNMEALSKEAKFRGDAQKILGAQIALTGDVTEFGRKTIGDRQLFGILGAGKQQIAYAKVALNVVDVKTSEIIHSVQGAGEYQLSNREIVGFGGTAAYDSTLNAKVLNLAITEAVNNLVRSVEQGSWRPSAQ